MSVVPAISVVVPTYNQHKMLERLVASFDALVVQQPFEVIVVNDCSTDATHEVLDSWLSRPHRYNAHAVHLEKNSGPGAARNAGLRKARGEIVAFTDTDCVVERDWLEKLVRKMDRNARIGGVGGKVLPLFEVTLVSRYYVINKSLEPPHNMHYLVTCNCCYFREPLLACGGFFDDIRKPGGEDIAASILMWKQGWRFAYDEEAIIHHDFRDNLRNFFKTWRNYGFGCAIVFHRLLDETEQNFERGQRSLPNYWGAEVLKPSVTGVRSLFRNLRMKYVWYRSSGISLRVRVELCILHGVERMAYLTGWKKGEAAFNSSG